MFNNYVWQTYLSGMGKEVVSFFKENLVNCFTEDYAHEICELHKAYCPSESVRSNIKEDLLSLFDMLNDGVYFFEEDTVYTYESAVEHFYKVLLESNDNSFQYAFDSFSCCIEQLSTLLSIEQNDLFVPYYFKCNFNVLEKIADEFDIELPDLPAKKDYENRLLYYIALCAVLHEFRLKHDMTPYELCAFLYDFAPKYVGGIDSYIIKELPEAKSAYFIGGTKDDAFLSDSEDVVTPWQCNPDTMAGDAIVMYLKTPISSIDSVWRSVSVGFNDPFFYYYRCTYIANPCKINRIPKKQLEEDAVFGQLPIVRKNLQGINGVELYPSVYNHLLDMAKSDLPRIAFALGDDLEFRREKDVENKLVKPFLAQLGYKETEYQQQLYIEIGNRNRALIPDFVINPVVSKGHYSADFLIEAKLTIPSNKMLEEVKTQTRSYAKQLGTEYAVIASKEGIWILSDNDDYSDSLFTYTWGELKQEDNFYAVFNLLGKGKL